MLIANPIYDTAFKFLMQDKESAELLLGTILETKVNLLNFSSTERVKNDYKFGIFRMDFKAEILVDGLKRNVILELQKAKISTDISRFRNYLGSQYSDNDNVIPIIAIYILNYHLPTYPEFILEINPEIKGKTTNTIYKEKDEFVDHLTHKTIILQIQQLEEPYKSETEKTLSFFDQHHQVDDYFINIPKIEERNSVLVKRLGLMTNDPELKKNLETERIIDREWAAKEKIIEELNEELENKDKEIENKDKELEKILIISIQVMFKSGMTKQAIATALNIDIQLVEKHSLL